MNQTNHTSGCAGDPNVPDFWIGVFASLVGSVVLNLGLNLQKYAFNKRGDKVRSTGMASKPIYTNKYWILGFTTFVVGNFGDFVGLTFTPQSVITPIGSISLVSNLFFAKCLLGEEIGWRTLIALGFILLGVVMIVVSSSAANPCGTVETVDSLLKRWEQGGFLTFACLHAVSLLTLLIMVLQVERKLNGTNVEEQKAEQKVNKNSTTDDDHDNSDTHTEHTEENIHRPKSVVVRPTKSAVVGSNASSKGSSSSSSSNDTNQINQIERTQPKKSTASLTNLSPKEQFFLRFAYPLLGSLFATWTVLLSKSTGELIKSSARNDSSQFSRFEVWPIMIGLVVSLPCQVMYLNKGLSWFEALYIVPIFYSVWVVSSIMMGALYFGEFNNFTALNFITFFIGVVLDIVGGVMLQARGIDDKNDTTTKTLQEHQEDVEDDAMRRTFSTGRGSDRSNSAASVEMVSLDGGGGGGRMTDPKNDGGREDGDEGGGGGKDGENGVTELRL